MEYITTETIMILSLILHEILGILGKYYEHIHAVFVIAIKSGSTTHSSYSLCNWTSVEHILSLEFYNLWSFLYQSHELIGVMIYAKIFQKVIRRPFWEYLS